MTQTSPFIEHILELMRPLGGVSARRMFGGYGIYQGRKMFAIVVADELFFKVGEVNRAAFEERGLKPFQYERKGKIVSLSYYAAPAECLDDANFMSEWAKGALRAALG